MTLSLLPFGPDHRVTASETAPELAPEIARRVEAIWQDEVMRSSRPMRNGRLMSVSAWSRGGAQGWLAEYKWFLAQRRDPSLFDVLRVRPLAVTGITLCADGVLIGRRRRDAHQDGGLWELVPAGGVDETCVMADGSADLEHQLVTELEEECGIGVAGLRGPCRPVAAVEDGDSHVIDIGLMIRTVHDFAEILRRFAAVPEPEHDALDIVPLHLIEPFQGERGAQLAPVSCCLLGAAVPHIRAVMASGSHA